MNRKKNNINECKLKDLFYSNKSLKDIERDDKVDQRVIRSLWRNTFGHQAVKDRSYKIRAIYVKKTKGLNEKIVNQIYELLENKNSAKSVSIILNISNSVVNKYLKKNKKLLDKVKCRNKIIVANNMQFLRKHIINQNKTISDDKKNEIMKYFNSTLFHHEIAKKVNVSSNSIINVFKKIAGVEKYKDRVKRLKPIRIRKIFDSLEKAGRLGSKPELAFFELLNNNLNTYVKHHDYDLIQPYEIDITLPNYKIAIFWDGIGHHKPIFGTDSLNKVQSRDKYKRKYLDNINWKWFEVIDLHSHWKIEHTTKQFHKLLGTFPELKDAYGC